MKEFTQSEFFIETPVPSEELIISRTDLKGVITYANDTFATISGYSLDELIGQSHNIVRHPDMPKRVFNNMWKVLKSEKKWEGVVKNLRKDKGFYWVHATISGVYKDGELIEYKSIRVPISQEEKLKYQRLYDTIKINDKEELRKVIYEKMD